MTQTTKRESLCSPSKHSGKNVLSLDVNSPSACQVSSIANRPLYHGTNRPAVISL